METTAYIALSRQAALRRQMEVVANNVANMNTTAYKGEHMMFREHLVKSRGGETPFGDKLAFAQDVATYRDLTPGAIVETGGPLDVALHGEGYLVVDTQDGPRYTRNGHLRLDATGQIVTDAGLTVLSTNNQPIFVAPTESEIVIAPDGTVSTENGLIGRLQVARFAREQSLIPVGAGLYQTEEPPLPAEKTQVVQGSLEGSNINPIVGMTTMIQIYRDSQNVDQMVSTEHERLRRAIERLGRVR